MEPVEVRNISIPKTGFIKKSEVATLFGCSSQTVMKWVKKDLLPPPLNYNEQFAGKLGPTSPVFWDAAEVWEAFDRLRGAA